MLDDQVSPTYQAPDTMPTDTVCRLLCIPNDPAIRAAVNDRLASLGYEHVWIASSGVSSLDMAAAMSKMLYEATSMIGTIVIYATTALPSGCLACDGTGYAKSDYPALYDVLNAEFIVDANNFVVPNLASVTVLPFGLNYAIVAQ